MSKPRRRAGGGYALFAALVVIAIVTVWMTNAALTTCYGVIATTHTRDRLNARIAANERAFGALPDGAGGSVWPEPPVDGFHDYVVADDATGRLRVVAPSELPSAGVLILRQWRLFDREVGGRLLDVSAVAVDAATRSAVTPPHGAEVRRSLIVE